MVIATPYILILKGVNMKPQTYGEISKEEIVLNYIRNSKGFRAFLHSLDDIEPLKGVTFTFSEVSNNIEREFLEDDLKRGIYSQKIESTNMDNPDVTAKIDSRMKRKELVEDKDGYSYE
jgi:hypothetical protein